VLYRIITQNKNRSEIITMLRRHFDGFTIYRATGYWKDTIEPALIIELDDIGDYTAQNEYTFREDGFGREVENLVKLIKKTNQQDTVLLQKINSESELI